MILLLNVQMLRIVRRICFVRVKIKRIHNNYCRSIEFSLNEYYNILIKSH